MHGEIIAIVAVLGFFGTIGLKILTGFVLQWRRAGSNKDLEELRRQVSELTRDYQQVKADHTDTLLGLEMNLRRLESRLDSVTGVAAQEALMAAPTPRERQL